MAAVILKVGEATKRYGGVVAVDNLSFEVYQGEILGVIGPNGSGKSTLMNLISGLTPLSAGDIWFTGISLRKKKTHNIARLGIARTFQLLKPFKNMTVGENVATGAMFGHIHRMGSVEALARSEEILASLGLSHQAAVPVNKLAVAEWRRLELARALAMDPKLLLLDEVMAGMVASEVQAVVETVKRLNREHGVTIIVVEHIMRAVMSMADRVLVLDRGKRLALGTPAQVARDPAVVSAYLGANYAKSFPKQHEVEE
ncbi:MAG TPA: ABC transporter ATP-binding protein [Thermodesulfobacteriota bacterium]|nr:ABC transporter ATP-binding protein [Thermodesulfobacteriota bacterium]